MSVTLIVFVMVAIPAVVIMFALIMKGDVRAAFSLARFSFQLEAKDRTRERQPGGDKRLNSQPRARD
ncbi:MAG: hypothetical protein IPP47_31750 [Bryobacterales bacterium]|nr:hypothetical protein [Bryobacterales bacterium]